VTCNELLAEAILLDPTDEMLPVNVRAEFDAEKNLKEEQEEMSDYFSDISLDLMRFRLDKVKVLYC
jgi:hypothetical protein